MGTETAGGQSCDIRRKVCTALRGWRRTCHVLRIDNSGPSGSVCFFGNTEKKDYFASNLITGKHFGNT